MASVRLLQYFEKWTSDWWEKLGALSLSHLKVVSELEQKCSLEMEIFSKGFSFHSGASGTRKRWKQWGRLLLVHYYFDDHFPDMLLVTNKVIFRAGALYCVRYNVILYPALLLCLQAYGSQVLKDLCLVTTYKLISALVALFSPQVLHPDDGSKLLPNCKYI